VTLGSLGKITIGVLTVIYSVAHAQTRQHNDIGHARSVGQNISENKQIFDSIKHDPNPLIVYGEPVGSKLEFLRTGKSTCGKYLYVKVTVPAGSGPPPHIHHWTDEWFYVPNGGAVMFHGHKEYKDIEQPPNKIGRDKVMLVPLEKGYIMHGPRYRIHGYTNATDKPIEVHIVWTPDTPDISILNYFVEIYAPIFNDKELNATFNSVQPIKAVGLAKKYGMNFSTSFWDYIDEIETVHDTGDLKLEKLKKLIKEGDESCKS